MKNITKEFLINNCKVKEENGQLFRWSNRFNTFIPLKLTPNTAKHPYGTDKTYIFVSLYDIPNKKPFSIPYHRFIWIWTYGDIPNNYDVHHRDGDSMNNNLSNLGLKSRKENLKERRGKKNQYK